MNIAITQREFDIQGWKYDCLQQDWYQFLKGHEIYSIPNTGTFDYSKMDCLILSGGNTSTNRESVERLAVNMFMISHLPIIGICHGAFALNRFLGGTNDSVEGHQGTEHGITMEFKKHLVNSYHSARIAELAEPLVPVAIDHEGSVEAFRHESLPIYGMVWHPERMVKPVLPTDLEAFLNV